MVAARSCQRGVLVTGCLGWCMVPFPSGLEDAEVIKFHGQF